MLLIHSSIVPFLLILPSNIKWNLSVDLPVSLIFFLLILLINKSSFWYVTRSHTLYKRLIFSFLSTWGLIHAILSLHEHITYYLYLKRWYYESNMETLYLRWSRAVVQHTPIGNTSFALLGVYWILFTYCVRFFYWTVSPILKTTCPCIWHSVHLCHDTLYISATKKYMV